MMRQLGLPVNRRSHEILFSCFHHALDHCLDISQIPVLSKTAALRTAFNDWLIERPENMIPVEELPYEVQKALPASTMKDRAAFFTGPEAAAGMTSAISRLTYGPIILCDPFCGGGALIGTIARNLGPKKVSKIYGFDVEPLSAMAAYITSVAAVEWDQRRVLIRLGDSFSTVSSLFTGGGLFGNKMIQKPDVVVTNPPYLPWTKVDDQTRDGARIFLQNSGYDVEDSNFTTYGMFLCDAILKKKGILCAVLPMSIFYNDKSRLILDLLYKRYDLRAILGRSALRTPYSLSCQASDVLVVGMKDESRDKFYAGMVTDDIMMKMMDNVKKMGVVDGWSPKGIGTASWLGEYNPSCYVVEPEVTEIMERIFKDVGDKITHPKKFFVESPFLHQGTIDVPVKMWFVPNTDWDLIGHDESFVYIQCKKYKCDLQIRRTSTVDVFLRPMESKGTVIAERSHHGLVFPRELTDDEHQYLMHWGIKRNGDWWTSYASEVAKSVWTHVHVARMLNLAVAYYAGICFYTRERSPPVSAMIRFSTGDDLDDKVMVSWYNSLPFMASLIGFGRRLREETIYITLSDYEQFPIPDLNKMDDETKLKFAAHVEELKEVTPFWDSIPRPHDIEWARWLGISDETLKELSDALRRSRDRWFVLNSSSAS